MRPPEIDDRQFPGHLDGDFVKGAANASAVGTLVERTSRLVMRVKFTEFEPASAANVLQGCRGLSTQSIRTWCAL